MLLTCIPSRHSVYALSSFTLLKAFACFTGLEKSSPGPSVSASSDRDSPSSMSRDKNINASVSNSTPHSSSKRSSDQDDVANGARVDNGMEESPVLNFGSQGIGSRPGNDVGVSYW